MTCPVLPFELLQGGWEDRWRFFDCFWSLWSGVEVDSSRGLDQVDAEYPLAAGLPPSAKRFLAFNLVADELDGMLVYRDCNVVERVPGIAATSLLMQGEGDRCWAVCDDSVADADPSVHTFALDWDESKPDAWGDGRIACPSVAGFAMEYHLSYSCSRGGFAKVRRSSSSVDDAQMERDFGPPVRFAGLEMFYRDGVFAIASGSKGSFLFGSFTFHFWDEAAACVPWKSIDTAIGGAYCLAGAAAERRSGNAVEGGCIAATRPAKAQEKP